MNRVLLAGLLICMVVTIVYFWIIPTPFYMAAGVTVFFTALRFALYHSSQNSLPFRPTIMIEMILFIVGVGISSLFPVKPVLAIRWLVWWLFANCIRMCTLLLLKEKSTS